MFYSSLKESGPLVAETKNTASALSKNDFILMGFGEHTSAIAFASDQPGADMTAQFGIRGVSEIAKTPNNAISIMAVTTTP
jgi:hypothetical protein